MYGGIREKPAPARGAGQHLLLVVDEPDMAELLSTTLELAAYRITVVGSGTEALARLTERRFDLLVVDATLPDMESIGRDRPAVVDRPPVLLLTVYESLDRLVPELGPGERDYVTKPFRVAEVLARVQVLLRGTGPRRPRGDELACRDLILDDTRCEARRGTRRLDLTPAEYRLLRHLLRQRAPGAVQGADRPLRLGRLPRRQRHRAACVPTASQGGPGRAGADPYPPGLRLLAGRGGRRVLRCRRANALRLPGRALCRDPRAAPTYAHGRGRLLQLPYKSRDECVLNATVIRVTSAFCQETDGLTSVPSVCMCSSRPHPFHPGVPPVERNPHTEENHGRHPDRRCARRGHAGARVPDGQGGGLSLDPPQPSRPSRTRAASSRSVSGTAARPGW
ncbi:hypothetical protein SALBM311S_02797 [Streptomyces alboniger]